ncbi:hypothetical protein DFJ74DRAFT_714158 [Hyaloraphidium curvatum]|nr:hypothetical protein DFJ74DRAFT_714158 [Hyaloraphidium curvatum]
METDTPLVFPPEIISHIALFLPRRGLLVLAGASRSALALVEPLAFSVFAHDPRPLELLDERVERWRARGWLRHVQRVESGCGAWQEGGVDELLDLFNYESMCGVLRSLIMPRNISELEVVDPSGRPLRADPLGPFEIPNVKHLKYSAKGIDRLNFAITHLVSGSFRLESLDLGVDVEDSERVHWMINNYSILRTITAWSGTGKVFASVPV